MDIISHGLRGGIGLGRKDKKNYWHSFFWGIFPDLMSFGILTISMTLGLNSKIDFANKDISQIPEYVNIMYNLTHSAIIFAIIFLVVWIIYRKPKFVLLAWLLHIIVDIPTHSFEFYATPFLWPISDFKVNGISWSNKYVFFGNRILLIILYLIFYIKKRAK